MPVLSDSAFNKIYLLTVKEGSSLSMKYSLEDLCTKKEDQVFDRKSARKDAK